MGNGTSEIKEKDGVAVADSDGGEEENSPWKPFWNGGAWRFDFYVEGKRHRRSTGVCDISAFEVASTIAKGVYYAAWERELSPCPTFWDAADLYKEEIDKNSKSVDQLKAYFGPHIRIDEIDAFKKKECKVNLSRGKNWKGGTIRRQVIVPLNAILNNALGLRSERVQDDTRSRIVMPEDAERLIAVAQEPPETVRDPDRRLLKMIAFLLGSGATPGEMFCVRAEDVNRATGEVWIRGEDPGAGKTPYRSRMVRPPARSWELIGELPSKGRVFLSTSGKEVIPDGKRGNTAIRQFHKLCAAAGLATDEETEPLVFYSLRHTWATFFSAQVGDHDLLVDRGGWATADMARRYRKRAPADLAARLLALGRDYRS